MDKKIWAVIPARYDSTRLPAKPIREIAGKPMVQWVWQAAIDAGVFERVIIASDDNRILLKATEFRSEARLTGAHHKSGTDRIAEVLISVYPQERPEFTINIQGDEPLLTGAILREFVDRFVESGKPIGTIVAPAEDREIEDSSVVKVVKKLDDTAIYFSRAAIPFNRDYDNAVKYLKHIGIYGFKTPALIEFAAHPPTMLERVEKLEQLRAIERGWDIYCVEIPEAAGLIGVDTEEDLVRASEAILRGCIG